jgi:hypothetical protein
LIEGLSKFHAGFTGGPMMQMTSGSAAATGIARPGDAPVWPVQAPAPQRGWTPIDATAAPIDVLAYVLADDALSPAAKVGILEQWRYDLLQLQIGADEGLDCAHDDGTLLQLISKTLSRLVSRCRRH